MSLAEDFILDRASVIGRLHVDKYMNNQDAMSVLYNDDFFIACVSDGCSGGPKSEVGSYLTANRITDSILRMLIPRKLGMGSIDEIKAVMEEVRLDTCCFLRNTASQLGHTMLVLQDCMLATASGFVMTPEIVFFFSIGDGVFYHNGQELYLQSEHAKYPDMVVYGAMAPETLKLETQRFSISALRWTDRTQSILVSTDGIHHMHTAFQINQLIPGTDKPVPPISELWKAETNAQALLRSMAKEVRRAEYDKQYDVVTQKVFKSPLIDDTTVVILKRKP